MSIHLHIESGRNLLDEITTSLGDLERRKQRRHELRILSCYVDFGALKHMIKVISQEVRLTSVVLMFEMMEIYRKRRPNEARADLKRLKDWCERQNCSFDFLAVRAGALVHAKAYCVVQQVDDRVANGLLWIGSGNATRQGLGLSGTASNVELSMTSTKKGDLKLFFAAWDQLAEKAQDISKLAQLADEYAFKYALLASGIFLHDWKEGLRSRLAVRYHLSAAAREAGGNTELSALGLTVERATATRNPFAHNLPWGKSRQLPTGFIKNCTVDTWLGRWCPQAIWDIAQDELAQDDAFNDFKSSFSAATGPEQLDAMMKAEAEVEKTLLARGLVKPEPERLQRWKQRVGQIRDNDVQLERIFFRFEPVLLPYDFSDRDEIEDLYENLLESIALRRKLNIASRLIGKSNTLRSLKKPSLSAEDREQIAEMFENWTNDPVAQADDDQAGAPDDW
ncbi:MAG: hypothetical protein ACT7A5_20490 [Ferrovibrionaceae bacterium]